ncbi:erythromycin esterase family protein [Nonomuraea sp. NPDC050404]|uniref:erythromycin esterase family protein n=1 Tax=Nonomuraea sp. NPDC050404 TaxID=3155783 RepID=UPI0033C712C6
MVYNRDAEIADTFEWIRCREDRIVLAAHNGHVQRWPVVLPGMGPATPMGMHLAARPAGAPRSQPLMKRRVM